MLAAERRDLLITRLRREGKLVARDLAVELGLSEDSVRRDLRDMAAAGLCQRVHGGALPASPAIGSHAKRSGIVPESKRRVAAKAAGRSAPSPPTPSSASPESPASSPTPPPTTPPSSS